MKALLVIIVALLACLVVYNYATTGQFTLVPAALQSAQQRELSRLEDRFLKDKARFEQAGRAAAVSGVDTSADAEAVRLDVERVETALRDLRDRLGDSGKQKIDQLMDRIQEFKKDLK
ncbi:MAG TPA: hypothetical protein VLW17_14580 [Thermoanaerobaculaceae bacterium]|nr:hypothetical protein [Thermoanaerobaculaceae bacterium]